MGPLMSCGDLPVVVELRRAFFLLFVIGNARLHCQDHLKKCAFTVCLEKKNDSLKVLAYGPEGNNELGSRGSFLLLPAASAILLCCRVENKIQGFIKTNTIEIHGALLYTSHKPSQK